MADNDHNLELDKLVWDEYKYRHELCWSLTFKITIAVATLSIIPYLDKSIKEQAGPIAFLTTFIAIFLGVIGVNRLNSELKHLDKVRKRHRTLQQKLFPEERPDMDRGWLRFTFEMKTYHWILIGLAILNAFIVSYFYIGWVTNLVDSIF